MAIFTYNNDLPENFHINCDIAVDTEALGLNNTRDRLCVLQFSNGDGDAHLVHFSSLNYNSPNLNKILSNRAVVKIFHYARFDVAIIYKYLNIMIENVYCTKIASKIARTYSSNHGLKDLCQEFLGINLSKQQQSSYWGRAELTNEQKEYAASDVLYLHKIRSKLDEILLRENRKDLANNCFNFLQTRVLLDLGGWIEEDVFNH